MDDQLGSRFTLATMTLTMILLAAGLFQTGTSSALGAPLQTLNLLGGVTSANQPVGSVDPYTEVSIDGGATWRPAILAGPNSSGWATAGGTNSWLNCRSQVLNVLDGSCVSPDPTPSTPLFALFRYRFWVPADFQNATITGQMNADNEASIYFNGFNPANTAQFRALGPIGGAQYWLPFDPARGRGSVTPIQSLLVAGWNTMYVTLIDTGSRSGINYNLTISIESDTPMSIGVPGNLVTFNPEGGRVSTQNATVSPGLALSSVTFPTPSRPGFTFDGWYTAPTGGQLADSIYAASTVPVADITLYARWTAIVPPPDGDSATELANTGYPPFAPSAGVLTIVAGATLIALRKTLRVKRNHSL